MDDPRPVVIDSNVWISALVFGGAPRQVFEQVVRSGTRVILSAEIIGEIRRVLAAKFPDFLDDFEALRAVLASTLTEVVLDGPTVSVCRDPDDNRVIETAVAGRAATIVSGDKDLLALGAYEHINIVRPAEWLTMHGGAAGARTQTTG